MDVFPNVFPMCSLSSLSNEGTPGNTFASPNVFPHRAALAKAFEEMEHKEHMEHVPTKTGGKST